MRAVVIAEPGGPEMLQLGEVADPKPEAREVLIGHLNRAGKPGGGYAEKACVPERQLLPVPNGVLPIDAASLPEVTCTVWSTLFMMSKLVSGETFLVHGGSSGIGTFAIQMAKAAIQMAKARGCKVFTTIGSAEKAKFVKGLGADLAINYRVEDLVSKVKEATGGKEWM